MLQYEEIQYVQINTQCDVLSLKFQVYYDISDQRKQEAERKQALSVQTHLRQAQASSTAPFVANIIDLVKQEESKS